jgi:hypothetical protein
VKAAACRQFPRPKRGWKPLSLAGWKPAATFLGKRRGGVDQRGSAVFLAAGKSGGKRAAVQTLRVVRTQPLK